MIYLLCGYMWLFVHRPFEVWPVLATLRIERVYMIFTLLCWLAVADKQLIRNRLNLAFALLALAILASAALGPYAPPLWDNTTVQNWLKVAVFFGLVMTCVRTERDLRILVIAFLGAMGLYMAHSLREYFCGRGVWRMGTWRMVGVGVSGSDPNSFAATGVYSLPMVYPLWKEWRGRRLCLGLVGYGALAATCILLTGSRGGFCGLLFLLGIATLLSRHRLKIILALAVAAPIVWRMLPEDRQNRYLTLIDPSYGPPNAQSSAESRGAGWRDGVRLWQEHPIFGVGPGAFGLARATRKGLQSHQLYGQVLGELGTLGAIGLGAVVWAFFANALALRRLGRQEPELAEGFPAAVGQAVTVTVLLLLFMGLGGHNLYRYTWLWFGAFQAVALHVMAARAAQLPAWQKRPAAEAGPKLADDNLSLAGPCQPAGQASGWQ